MASLNLTLEIESPWKSIGHGLKVPEGMPSESGVIQVDSWLKSCLTTHDCFRPYSCPRLPSRVIEVGPLGQDGYVKLKETEEEYDNYLCLSHCWGEPAKTLKTFQNNLLDFKLEIPWSSLPKTFQDAIIITRSLHQRYLWIDSLCIVQDDKDDWRRESVQMSEIYRNSHLTLAATSSKDSEGGLFYAKQEVQRISVTHPDQGPVEVCYQERFLHWGEARHSIVMDEVKRENFPLLLRGWCYQEQMLSPRILHFCKHEMVWQCEKETICQCFGSHSTSKAFNWSYEKSDQGVFFRKSKSLRDCVVKTWWRDAIHQYSSRELSVGSDRLIAFSGLAKHFQKADNRYLAGLWSDTLLENLLWKITHVSTTVDSNKRLPTWSWTSRDGYCSYPDYLEIDQAFITISEVNVVNINRDPFQGVEQGAIKLSGPAIPCTLRYKSQSSRISNYSPMGSIIEFTLSGSIQIASTESLYFDYDHHLAGPSRLPDGASLLCLRMVRGRSGCCSACCSNPRRCPTLRTSDFALLLHQVDKEEKIFERIGIIQEVLADSKESNSCSIVFNNAHERIITLV
jgi:Heterokaryon incompatibility protein (HET)